VGSVQAGTDHQFVQGGDVRWVGPAGLQRIAAECVALVATEYSTHLDWSLDSLAEFDEVCANLLAEGPLRDERLELWWKLIGAYTGEADIK
jgi:hypothetical protein